MAVVFTLLTSLTVSLPASATHVGCGAVITQTTTLDSDVGPCPGPDYAILIATDNVKFDLNGHKVFGTPNPFDGAGILVRGSRGVKVTNGEVTQFDGGVVIEGGGENNVTGIWAHDNLGHSENPHSGNPSPPVTRYGEGIAVEGSSDNRIADNRVINNGPFAGIGLYEVPDRDHPFPAAPVERNAVMNNVVEDNVFCRVNRRPPPQEPTSFCDNDGIRLEPQVGPDNMVKDNIVRGNGLDGISLFGFATGNTVMGNVVEANGFNGAVPGDGIRVFGFGNVINKNRSFDNRNDGISVARRNFTPPPGPFTHASFPAGNPNGRNNRIIQNDTGGNLRLDLWDSNPNCDENVWRNNTFSSPVKAQPPCTRLPDRPGR